MTKSGTASPPPVPEWAPGQLAESMTNLETTQLKLERDACTMVSARYLNMMTVKDEIIASMHAERAEAAKREQELRKKLEAPGRFSRAECIAAFKDTLAQINGDQDVESTRALKEQLNTLRQANVALRQQLDSLKCTHNDDDYFHKDILENYVHRETYEHLQAHTESLRNEVRITQSNLSTLAKTTTELQSKLQTAEKNLKETESKLFATEDDLEEAEEKITELEEELKGAEFVSALHQNELSGLSPGAAIKHPVRVELDAKTKQLGEQAETINALRKEIDAGGKRDDVSWVRLNAHSPSLTASMQAAESAWEDCGE